MWTAFICIGMLIQRRDGATFPRRKRTVFYIFGLLLVIIATLDSVLLKFNRKQRFTLFHDCRTPIILTVSLKIVSHDIRHLDVNAFYRYGRVQVSMELTHLEKYFICEIILPKHLITCDIYENYTTNFALCLFSTLAKFHTCRSDHLFPWRCDFTHFVAFL